MSIEIKKAIQLEIAHVLFIDIVGYSKLSINEQRGAVDELTQAVRASQPFQDAEAAGRLIKIPTGDGMALVFYKSPEEPVECALEISRTFKERPKIQLRMGVHSGPVSGVIDVNGQANLAGAGLNMAQRVMDCGDAGHILLSKRVADDLGEYEHWQPLLHDLGECQVKHGMRVSIVNLHADEVGNPQLPKKFQALKKHKARKRWAGVMAALLVLVVALIVISKRSARSTSTIPEKSVAVLPFVNMSADKADEYLSDGMTEELLNALTKVKRLRVPGRSSSFAFKDDHAQDIFRKVGEQLHVNAVLEGSVRKAGDKLRITAQLVNVADGFHLWSETYDGDMKDILAVQSDVAQRVVQALQMQLGVEEARALTKKPTENAEAYRLYLLGRYHFTKYTRIGWTNATHYFEQALQVDPTYALAYCGLADVYGWAGGQILAGKEAWAKEKELALKGLALDPNLADAHLSLGVALFDSMAFRGSENELKRAIELNPNLGPAYDQYAWSIMVRGRVDEAIALEKKALELDPLNPLLNNDFGFLYNWARRYDEGIVQLRKTLELDPNNPWARATLGWCLHWKGKKADALAEFQKAAALDDLPLYKGSLGYAYAASGDRAKAEQILRDLDEIAKTQYVSPANRVPVYLGLGENERALDWLEKAYEDRDPILWWINGDQLYDSVRNEPRFKTLMQNVERLKEGAAP
jgi:TolB-like protein/class 3 adenylate cyclase/Flp pilus assembly protein TadD